jgi:hypothetical protein
MKTENERLVELIEKMKEFKKCSIRKFNASKVRADMPMGTSRARVTSSNAKLKILCAEYERQRKELIELIKSFFNIFTAYDYEEKLESIKKIVEAQKLEKVKDSKEDGL